MKLLTLLAAIGVATFFAGAAMAQTATERMPRIVTNSQAMDDNASVQEPAETRGSIALDGTKFPGETPWLTGIEFLDQMRGQPRNLFAQGVGEGVGTALDIPIQSAEPIPGNSVLVTTEPGIQIRGMAGDHPVVTIEGDDEKPPVFIMGPRRELFCSDLEPLALNREAIPQAQIIAIDISGSMDGETANAFRAAGQTIAAMPENATCGIIAFNGDVFDLGMPASATGDNRWITARCGDALWDFIIPDLASRVQASGGTASETAIFPALDFLNRAEFEDHLRTVLVLSDGDNHESSYSHIDAIIAQKGQIALWSHEHDTDPSPFYADVADGRSFETFDASAGIQAAFAAYATQQQSAFIVHERQCTADDLQTASAGTPGATPPAGLNR